MELGVSSPFSFLRGASDAIELVLAALGAGMDLIGIADRNTLAGVVRMHSAAKGAGLRPLIGCRLDLSDAPSLLAYPIDRDGYGRLSRMLSLGKMRAKKGECELALQDVADHDHGIAFIAWPKRILTLSRPSCRGFAAHCRHSIMSRRAGFIAAMTQRGSSGSTGSRERTVAIFSPPTTSITSARPPAAAGLVTCIREKVTIATAGFLLNPNAERHLKSPAEMARLFERWPHAIEATRAIRRSRSTSASMSCGTNIRKRLCPRDKRPQQYLEQLTWEGAKRRLA